MPHSRSRQALALLKKKLKFSRVVTLQGARQCGKSYLARVLFDRGLYETLDRTLVREEAESRIGVFLIELQRRAMADKKNTVVIDEAQKVPKIFDEIKAMVDENESPGQFLLLGSTEFSLENQIKESLTGRVSRLRLYPMTLSECFSRETSPRLDGFWKSPKLTTHRKEILEYLRKGGFPAMFSIRDESERRQKLDEWLRLTFERDVLQIKGLKPDSNLCALIFQNIPFLDYPTSTQLAQTLNRSPRKIQTQLKALSQVFSIHTLDPHPLGTGKPTHYLIDPAFAEFFGANFMSKLTIAIVSEFLAKQSYQAISPCRFFFYRSTKGAMLPLVIELGPKRVIALDWIDRESVRHQDVQTLKAFQAKAEKKSIRAQVFLLAGVKQRTVVEGVTVLPWEAVF